MKTTPPQALWAAVVFISPLVGVFTYRKDFGWNGENTD
jgi:hypothetical protein